MKKSHRKNLIFRLTLIPTLVISSTLLTIAPEDVYAIHHLLPPEKVAFSPLYGYCAWRSRLIFFLHAFAPESSALGKLVRTLFYKQPFDGTLIPTQNPRSVVRTISHQLWGEIVSLVKSNKSSMEELSTLIDAKTAWQNECKQGLKIIENTLQSDAEYQEIFDQIAGLEKEKSALIGKTGTEALMSRKNIKLQITKLNKALRARVDNLPQEKKALIFGNERDQKSPEKLARIIVEAAEECGSIWPENLVYTIISALVETTAASADDLACYLSGLGVSIMPSNGNNPQKLEINAAEKITKAEFKALLEKDPAQLALGLIGGTYQGIIENVPYRKDIPFNGDQFADCTEIAILNLINWLAYDEKTGNLSLKNIENLSPLVSLHKDIKAYYQKFPTPSSQKSFEAHTAWVKALSNISDAHYIKKDHELKTDEASVVRVLAHCIFSKNTAQKNSLQKILNLFGTLVRKRDPTSKISHTYQKKDTPGYWTLAIESAKERVYFVAAPHHAAFIQIRTSIPAIAFISEQLVSEKNSPEIEQLLVSMLFLERFSSIEPLSGKGDLRLIFLAHFLSLESNDALKITTNTLSNSKKLAQEKTLQPYIEEILHRAFLYHPDVHTDEALKEHILRALPKELSDAIDRMIHRTINGKSIASEIKRLHASSSSTTVT